MPLGEDIYETNNDLELALLLLVRKLSTLCRWSKGYRDTQHHPVLLWWWAIVIFNLPKFVFNFFLLFYAQQDSFCSGQTWCCHLTCLLSCCPGYLGTGESELFSAARSRLWLLVDNDGCSGLSGSGPPIWSQDSIYFFVFHLCHISALPDFCFLRRRPGLRGYSYFANAQDELTWKKEKLSLKLINSSLTCATASLRL